MEPKKDESEEKCYDPIDCLKKFLAIVMMFLMILGMAKLAENTPCFCTFYQPEFPRKN